MLSRIFILAIKSESVPLLVTMFFSVQYIFLPFYSEYMNYVIEALELEDTIKNYERRSLTGWFVLMLCALLFFFFCPMLVPNMCPS